MKVRQGDIEWGEGERKEEGEGERGTDQLLKIIIHLNSLVGKQGSEPLTQ